MMTILIVDDFMYSRKAIESMILTEFVKNRQVQIIEAINGKEALDKFNSRKIHLVITDLNMPEMNGIELTRSIRASKEYHAIPVVLVTTEKDPEKIKKAHEAGVTAILRKPFNLTNLTATLVKVTH